MKQSEYRRLANRGDHQISKCYRCDGEGHVPNYNCGGYDDCQECGGYGRVFDEHKLPKRIRWKETPMTDHIPETTTDPIAAAFARLEEWVDADSHRVYKHTRCANEHASNPKMHWVTLENANPDNRVDGIGSSFPAAVDAALAQWEKGNG